MTTMKSFSLLAAANLVLALCGASAALAQAPAAPAAVTAPAAAAPVSSAAKKEWVQKILVLQQPAIEGMARQLAEAPASRLMQQAGPIMQQRVPAEKREAVAKEIQADLRKYADEAVPLVRERALKLAPSTIGVLLEEKFTEDELKQIVALLESPVNKKFQQLAGEMQRSLGEKLVADTRATIEPKVKALEASIGKHLGAAPAPAKPAAGNGTKK